MTTLVEFFQLIDNPLLHDNKRVVFVNGNFNTLHPGHIRLLKFAKECGDILVVGINADSIVNNPTYLAEQYRAEVVSALAYVDFCFINRDEIQKVIMALKPNIMVKGVEYQNKDNPETLALEKFNGKLIFCSGDAYFNEGSVQSSKSQAPVINSNKLNGYLSRRNITLSSCSDTVRRFSELNVVVIGDVIIDQYVQCSAVGMSQEDPTIVVTPNQKSLYLGGSGITASHAKAMGANCVKLYTVTGADEYSNYTKQKLAEYGVEVFLSSDETRPTNLKTRYRVGSKTMLRVNEVRNHDIEKSLQKQIIKQLESEINNVDVLIFSDFNYGVLPQTLVDQIIQLCIENNVIMAADSQSSSQVGDISRFSHVDIITPTEREARLALNNAKDGLVVLSEKLRQKCDAKHVVVTLAENGAFLHKPLTNAVNGDLWVNDKIAALAEKVEDPAGAGDCFLAAATLSLAVGADFWHASFVGAVAAACQVSRVGNTPLQQSELDNALSEVK
ncbi:PfkB family carbohydrate kinase [Catenovulum sediminis]|uniref:PfkB family carbohydrate kinase n=1 Tax=Catenovulum sediminis TaxID=1740262 RepID=UPI00117FF45D|nr:PfkB family carbohydrate kinase [Catenovulum sediminis]